MCYVVTWSVLECFYMLNLFIVSQIYNENLSCQQDRAPPHFSKLFKISKPNFYVDRLVERNGKHDHHAAQV